MKKHPILAPTDPRQIGHEVKPCVVKDDAYWAALFPESLTPEGARRAPSGSGSGIPWMGTCGTVTRGW